MTPKTIGVTFSVHLSTLVRMSFKGTLLPIGELIALAQAEPEPDWRALYGHIGLESTAADAARFCAELIAEGRTLSECWRFGILQTVDYYDSAVRRGGVELGAQVFAAEPERTGAQAVDAAFAALADHLGERDGWKPAPWAADPSRRTHRWFAAQPVLFHDEALRDSPRAFRDRGIFITSRGLNRA